MVQSKQTGTALDGGGGCWFWGFVLAVMAFTVPAGVDGVKGKTLHFFLVWGSELA